MRRPVICTPRLALDFLEIQAAARGARFAIELNHPEGAWVGAGEPILHVTGSLFHLADLETVLLQKLGSGLRRGVQRLCDVRRAPQGRVFGDGRAALCGRRNG